MLLFARFVSITGIDSELNDFPFYTSITYVVLVPDHEILCL